MEKPTEVKLCSACGKNPRVDQRDKSTNTQCSECKYDVQKKWTANKANQDQAQAFAAGVAATKIFVAGQFEKAIRGASINGFEAARLVLACKGPSFSQGPDSPLS